MKYKSVVAAAGLSSRMHEFKPLMKLGDSTMVDTVIRTLKEAGAGEVTVVVGYRAEMLRPRLEQSGVTVVENGDYAHTKMLDSIQLGLRALEAAGDYDYVFITPVDVPLVSLQTLEKMKLAAECGYPIVRPSMDGRAGHPVLLCRSEARLLTEYRGDDGLRGYLRGYGDSICYVTVDDVGILTDADTQEDYTRLQRMEYNRNLGGGLWYGVDVRVARGEMVLNAEMAQLLEMIDHTGSLHRACECIHMSYSKGRTKLKQMEKVLGDSLTVRTPGEGGGGGIALSSEGRMLLRVYRRFSDAINETADTLFKQIVAKDNSKQCL